MSNPAVDGFAGRHIGPSPEEIEKMLTVVGADSLDDLIYTTFPDSIRDDELNLPEALSEEEAIAKLRAIADKNQVFTSLIGQGYSNTFTPGVIRRNVLENPGWYTSYTPYQPEISQGRLEALFNFQTMIADLCGLEIANASLLDEATAAAEAMTMLARASRTKKTTFAVDAGVHPQTLAVIETRAAAIGTNIAVIERNSITDGLDEDVYAVLLQYPGTEGEVYDLAPLCASAHDQGALVAVAADILSLVVLQNPGEAGADVVVGSSQRFGVPLGAGGPHAAFMATKGGMERSMPGRVVGMSVDADGAPALRLALQTREQHIRRERATSNICTAQALLAVMAAMYASYHGPEGLQTIAWQTHAKALRLATGLSSAGLSAKHEKYFDTVTVELKDAASAQEVIDAAVNRRINLRRVNETTISVAFDETSTNAIVDSVLECFGAQAPQDAAVGENGVPAGSPVASLARTDEILDYEPFHRYRSETEMLRYLRRLSDMDLALDRTMIPLGSCTMKLNATSEMEPITWAEFANIHPFAPVDQRQGYVELVAQLEEWLTEITGYAKTSIQPNAGSQGEFAGLLAIRKYHEANGDTQRKICLIPSSAHGTNAASAVMAGLRVVVVACTSEGDVDLADLDKKISKHGDELAAIMITYPSTHGVFETEVVDICAKVHEAGGQVYLDGANLNAMVGLARPGRFGADVSHLNLHKTFCIPHGGGGPGVGPVAVGEHLVPFLPNHQQLDADGAGTQGDVVSAGQWGSAQILPISWMYIAMMGPKGLRKASEIAILNANYVAARLAKYFPVLYRGDLGRVGHECIVDLRPIRDELGLSIDDIAKRLVDHGIHAPTMSFPVAGTLMIEPTESESLEEIDRFIDAMASIASEVDRVRSGEWPKDDNPLVHSPHPATRLLADDWAHPYSREIAAYPTASARANKVWAPVSRIDGVHGDRNFVCSCPPLEELAEDFEDSDSNPSA